MRGMAIYIYILFLSALRRCYSSRGKEEEDRLFVHDLVFLNFLEIVLTFNGWVVCVMLGISNAINYIIHFSIVYTVFLCDTSSTRSI